MAAHFVPTSQDINSAKMCAVVILIIMMMMRRRSMFIIKMSI